LASLLVLPLNGSAGIRGAVTLGSNTASAYSPRAKEIVAAVKETFERILNEMSVEELQAQAARCESALKEFVSDIAVADTFNDVFLSAARTVAQVTGSPIIRISTIDPEQKFISSRALRNQCISKSKVPDNGHILLSMLAWHKVAAISGNTVLVKYGDAPGKMSEVEAAQVFAAGINQAAIIPIKFGDKVYGLISVADTWSLSDPTLTAENIQFVETLAAVLAVAVDANYRTSEALVEFAATAKSAIVDSSRFKSMRTQLRSSLTGILGSLEMLRTAEPARDPKKNRFMEIIDKSAHKLEEMLKD
jgi:K+-sensing histidine kinase KdpD